jgi:hypothetical protein
VRRDAETKGRCGVCWWQERKGSRSLRRLPFMQKVVPSLRSAATGKKSNGCLHLPPLLSNPMTGGPGPASQRRGCWRIEGEAESEPPELRDGLE